MSFFKILACAAVVAVPNISTATTITGDNFSLDVAALPSAASLLTGSFSTSIGSVADVIDGDVGTGAFNLVAGTIFDFVFSSPVMNGSGADFAVIDGRFDVGAFDFSIDGGANFFAVSANDFVSSGASETLTTSAGSFPFTPFVANVDLSDFGFSASASFGTLQIRASNDSVDLLGVASLEAAVPAVPLPAGLPLLLGGLAVFGLMHRKRRTASSR